MQLFELFPYLPHHKKEGRIKYLILLDSLKPALKLLQAKQHAEIVKDKR